MVNEPMEPIMVPVEAAELYREIVERGLSGEFSLHIQAGRPRTAEYTRRIDLGRKRLTDDHGRA